MAVPTYCTILTDASRGRSCPVATGIAYPPRVTREFETGYASVLSNGAKIGEIGVENPSILQF